MLFCKIRLSFYFQTGVIMREKNFQKFLVKKDEIFDIPFLSDYVSIKINYLVMGFKRHFLTVCCMLAAVASVFAGEEIVLKGNIKGFDPTKFLAIYSYTSDFLERDYKFLTGDSVTGDYTLTLDMPVDRCELVLNSGRNAFNLVIEKGKTAVLNADLTNPRAPKVTVAGDNAAINRLYWAFDSIQSARSEEKPYREQLRKSYASIRPLIDKIPDAADREYYGRLFDMKLNAALLNNIWYQSQQRELTADEKAEKTAILNTIDPNDPFMSLGMVDDIWLGWRLGDEDFITKVTPADFEGLEVIDKEVTEPGNRRRLLNNRGSRFFRNHFPKVADVDRFLPRYKEVAAAYPDLIERYQAEADKVYATAPGTPIPYLPELEAVDGSRINMKDLFGKVIYIDVWATWCGPCCAEIPYLEKVVERFKDRDDICFVSLSMDATREPWLAKLEKDKPSWPQYRLTEEEADKFMKAVGFDAIPRFFIIAPDGTFVSSNAERPSAPEIDAILENAVSNK